MFFDYLNRRLDFKIKKYNDSKIPKEKETYLIVAKRSTRFEQINFLNNRKSDIDLVIRFNESNLGNRILLVHLESANSKMKLEDFTKEIQHDEIWVTAEAWRAGTLGLNEYEKYKIKTYEEAEKELFLHKLSNVYNPTK